MLIDLDALQRAGSGEPDTKVAVRKAWLKSVHAELVELQRLRTQHALGDRIAGIGEKIMGMAGAR